MSAWIWASVRDNHFEMNSMSFWMLMCVAFSLPLFSFLLALYLFVSNFVPLCCTLSLHYSIYPSFGLIYPNSGSYLSMCVANLRSQFNFQHDDCAAARYLFQSYSLSQIERHCNEFTLPKWTHKFSIRIYRCDCPFVWKLQNPHTTTTDVCAVFPVQ